MHGYFNVLDLSREFKIKHLIYASSSSVYGNQYSFPITENNNTDSQESFYALSKKIGEVMSKYYSKMYFMKITSLRFFTVYGPYGRPDMAMYKFTEKFIKIRKLKFLIMENTYEILHIFLI